MPNLISRRDRSGFDLGILDDELSLQPTPGWHRFSDELVALIDGAEQPTVRDRNSAMVAAAKMSIRSGFVCFAFKGIRGFIVSKKRPPAPKAHFEVAGHEWRDGRKSSFFEAHPLPPLCGGSSDTALAPLGHSPCERDDLYVDSGPDSSGVTVFAPEPAAGPDEFDAGFAGWAPPGYEPDDLDREWAASVEENRAQSRLYATLAERVEFLHGVMEDDGGHEHGEYNEARMSIPERRDYLAARTGGL